MHKQLFLLLAVITACSPAFSQDFSMEQQEPEPAEVMQEKRHLILKVRPAAMIISPVTWSFWRNGNLEVEVGVGDQMSVSGGLNIGFFGFSEIIDTASPDIDAQGLIDMRFFSGRTDFKYYFKRKKPKAGYYTMEGFFVGAYYKFQFAEMDYLDPAETDIRQSINSVGLLGGYQQISRRGFTFIPLVGFGMGLSSGSDGFTRLNIDVRAGLSIGFAVF